MDGTASLDVTIDAGLARCLVDAQFPEWAGLEIAPVALSGVDNRTFRLGDALSVRLPAGDWYALQVEKEQRWLPALAPSLPLPIPDPVAAGSPGCGYPFRWSVYRWLAGESASEDAIGDLVAFARDLAGFLVALRGADARGGPAPGRHNFFRGGPLSTYGEETLRAIEAQRSVIDAGACLACWEDALDAPWDGSPVWFHGDVAVGNLLVRDGRLAAVIDFGTSGVGDPACDVVIAWTFFSGAAREAFRAALDVDDATWSRGRGWALWKALITLDADPRARLIVERVLADHASRR
jgi:aminoglycoside phosphotransferase (APT) family kinase protein